MYTCLSEPSEEAVAADAADAAADDAEVAAISVAGKEIALGVWLREGMIVLGRMLLLLLLLLLLLFSAAAMRVPLRRVERVTEETDRPSVAEMRARLGRGLRGVDSRQMAIGLTNIKDVSGVCDCV
jgi:hypothetical protein